MDQKSTKRKQFLFFFSHLVFSFQEAGRACPARGFLTRGPDSWACCQAGRRPGSPPQGQPMKLTVRWEIVPWMDIIEHGFFFFSKVPYCTFSFLFIPDSRGAALENALPLKKNPSIPLLDVVFNLDTVYLSQYMVGQSTNKAYFKLFRCRSICY